MGQTETPEPGSVGLCADYAIPRPCCLPFGIVATVKSGQVNALWAQGRYVEAQASADSAKKWVMWSVIIAWSSSRST
ncbi:CD225/dispanin family protein [Mycobacterium servetii]|uniref:CD225/dispanin family protein n=1 Tax=Mycobacterium servetii TaxID=3237418 RepID=UPI0035107C6C